MRRHWLIWGPFLLFLSGWAVLGLRHGYLVATTDESAVIARFAEKYLEDRARDGTGEGAAKTDCVAYPAAPEDAPVWLVVSCGPTPYDAARHYEYYVTRTGRLENAGGPKTWGET